MPPPDWQTCRPPIDLDLLVRLYEREGLSTRAIGARTGIERQRVTRALRKAGVAVRPRGAGRRRPVGGSAELPCTERLLRALYQDARLSSRQIGSILGMPERTVRGRLGRYGIKARTRGGWNREDRTTVPGGVLEVLYVELGMTAAEVGERLGVSAKTVLRSAHALGVPVRSGGVVPMPGPEQIELVNALYADPLIAAALAAHDVPRVLAGGSLSRRFPVPVPLTTSLIKDLYWGCGTSLNHIELLTGQAAESVRGFMRRTGIPLRHTGGQTPFLRRWRSAPSAGGLAGNTEGWLYSRPFHAKDSGPLRSERDRIRPLRNDSQRFVPAPAARCDGEPDPGPARHSR